MHQSMPGKYINRSYRPFSFAYPFAGVNLPAHLVVVKSTQAWRGGAAGYQEYPRATLLQMMGRAGRPQFDTEGVVVLMTQSHTRDMYMRALSSPRGLELPPLESSLPSSLVEHLASEICIGTIRTLQEALQWLRSTFMSIRMMKNPVHYGLTPAGDLTAMRRTVLQHLRAVCAVTSMEDVFRILRLLYIKN
jgi:replicative superfamily II helicase